MSIMTAQIRINDGMTNALKSMITALNVCVNTFEKLQNVSSRAVDTKAIESAKNALSQVDNIIDGLDININEATNQQENFNQSIKDSSSSADILATKFERVGKIITTAFAVNKIGSALKSAINVGKNFEESMSQVAATKGITSANNDYNILANAAKHAGSTTKYSATEAAQALNYLALANYDTQQSAYALPKVLNFAAAGGLELAYASDVLTDSMSALGLGLDKMEMFGDQLAKTAQKSNTSVAQLSEGILTIGGTAKNLAGGTVELNALLGILADNGKKASEGGTLLRNIMNSLTAPTDKAAVKLKELGVAVYDANGRMKSMDTIFSNLKSSMANMTQQAQTNALNTIFNKNDLVGVQALLSGCGNRYKELSTQISNSKGAMQDMADTMNDNLAGDIKAFKSVLEGIGISIYEKFQKPLRMAMANIIANFKVLASSIKNGALSNSFNKLAKGISNLISIISNFITTVLPLIINVVATGLNIISSIGNVIFKIFNIATPVIYGVITAFVLYNLALSIHRKHLLLTSQIEKLLSMQESIRAARLAMLSGATFTATATQYGFNAALLACPITWIVMGIIAIITIISTLIIWINKAKGETVNTIGVICGCITVAISFIANIFIGFVNFVIGTGITLYNAIAVFINGVATGFNNLGAGIVQVFYAVFDTVLGIIQAIAGMVDTVFGSNLAGAVSGFRGKVSNSVDKLIGDKKVNIMPTIDQSKYKLNEINYKDAYNKGYKFGAGLSNKKNKIKDDYKEITLDNLNLGLNAVNGANSDLANNGAKTADNTGKTADNSKKVADNLKLTDEDLKFLKDIAEREIIDRTVFSSINVNMGGINNNVSSNVDLDGIVDYLSKTIEERISISAEGVHS